MNSLSNNEYLAWLNKKMPLESEPTPQPLEKKEIPESNEAKKEVMSSTVTENSSVANKEATIAPAEKSSTSQTEGLKNLKSVAGTIGTNAHKITLGVFKVAFCLPACAVGLYLGAALDKAAKHLSPEAKPNETKEQKEVGKLTAAELRLEHETLTAKKSSVEEKLANARKNNEPKIALLEEHDQVTRKLSLVNEKMSQKSGETEPSEVSRATQETVVAENATASQSFSEPIKDGRGVERPRREAMSKQGPSEVNRAKIDTPESKKASETLKSYKNVFNESAHEFEYYVDANHEPGLQEQEQKMKEFESILEKFETDNGKVLSQNEDLKKEFKEFKQEIADRKEKIASLLTPSDTPKTSSDTPKVSERIYSQSQINGVKANLSVLKQEIQKMNADNKNLVQARLNGLSGGVNKDIIDGNASMSSEFKKLQGAFLKKEARL